jgi:hypothetical protein
MSSSSSNVKEMSDCPVCYDKYTAQVRKPVQCPYCDFAACAPCNKKYLTESMMDAHCMGCRRAWNDEFVDLNFTRAFRTGPWKKHRENILIDREMALLPTRQPRIEAMYKLREVEVEMDEHNKEIYEFDKQIAVLRKQRDLIEVKKNRLRTKQTRYEHESRGVAPPAWTMGNGETVHKQERAQFIMKCPDEECRGFLSTAYKCGTCQKYACKDCLEVLGATKPEDHVCNEERKASVALIIKESKPCPKCGTRISKVDGCDQIWCVDCHTAFSWNTGRVENGVIHNPHYYEYLRQNNGGVAPRNAGDVPCGGVPTYYEVLARVRNLPVDTQREMGAIHRIVTQIHEERVQRYQGAFNENDNGDLGVKYLMKEVTKEEMKKTLAQRETKRNKQMAIRAVLEMFATTGLMMLNAIVNGGQMTREQYTQYHTEFVALRTYTNENLRRIGQMKHCSVPQIGESGGIHPEWRWVSFHAYTPTASSSSKRKPKSSSNAANNGGGDDNTTVTTEYDNESVVELE